MYWTKKSCFLGIIEIIKNMSIFGSHGFHLVVANWIAQCVPNECGHRENKLECKIDIRTIMYSEIFLFFYSVKILQGTPSSFKIWTLKITRTGLVSVVVTMQPGRQYLSPNLHLPMKLFETPTCLSGPISCSLSQLFLFDISCSRNNNGTCVFCILVNRVSSFAILRRMFYVLFWTWNRQIACCLHGRTILRGQTYCINRKYPSAFAKSSLIVSIIRSC